MRSSNRARKALTASNRHWGYMSIRAVRQTPYKKYNGTAPNERTDTVIPYRIEHVYVLESGFNERMTIIIIQYYASNLYKNKNEMCNKQEQVKASDK